MSGAREDLPAGPYQATLYPSGDPAGSAARPKWGVCLSGGGSRALTCALGQLSGLRSLPDPDDPTRCLLDRVAYLSSVSGGSWASVIYSFLPATIGGRPVGDDELLIEPCAPGALRKAAAADADPANVNYLDPHCLGTAPQGFRLGSIAKFLHTLYQWGFFRDSRKWSWFWIAAVGELILKRFELFEARFDPAKAYFEPQQFFSLSSAHVDEHIRPHNPSLDAAQFHLVRAGRPWLVVNTNLLQDARQADPPQTPVQATPVATGALGCSPDGTIKGGGSVESFAFTSTLSGPAGTGAAELDLARRYALCDIAGCSSAFFAEALLDLLNREIDRIIAAAERVLPLPAKLAADLAAKLRAELESFLDRDASELIPRYNYWPLGAAAGRADNSSHGFSDGGDFENTGILGLLARTDADRIVAFVNSENPLRRDPGSGEILVSGQLASLFGYRPDPVGGVYQPYGGMRADQPLSYAQVFDDEQNRFAQLRRGLYRASCGGPDADAELATHPAAFSQRLTTVDNPVAHVRGGREVTVLWVYNNRVNRWQDAIEDANIRAALAAGQAGQQRDGAPREGSGAGRGPVANFPWYQTAGQIHLEPEAVNLLAQLSAWNVRQLESELRRLIP